jgi:hypothetical protein
MSPKLRFRARVASRARWVASSPPRTRGSAGHAEIKPLMYGMIFGHATCHTVGAAVRNHNHRRRMALRAFAVPACSTAPRRYCETSHRLGDLAHGR